MRRLIGAVLGPLVFAGLLWVDLPVPREAAQVAAVTGLMIVFWVTEALPVPVTALLGSVLCVALGVAPAAEVFAPYGDPVIFLFLGAFLVGEALQRTGLDRRIASTILGVRALSSTPTRRLATIGAITALLSMWMSNTAAAAVLMPVVLSLVGPGSPRDAPRAVLTVAYAASIGGIATPIGTPPNLIAIAFLDRTDGVHIGFGDWIAFATPLMLILLATLWVLFARPGTRATADHPEAGPPGRWTLAERLTACVFLVMLVGWLAPSLASLLGGPEAARSVGSRWPEAIVALSGAISLFALPSSVRPWRPILDRESLARVDWGTILLFGGGLSLGALVGRTGLGEWVGRSLLDATGVESQAGLVFLSAVSAVVLTEFMSNTAAISVVAPVVHAMAIESGVSSVPPVVAAALAASMAFMLPVSTPPNAIAYGTGLVSIPEMLRRGILLDLVATIAIGVWVIWFGPGS